jgi:hypothetical protein
VGPAYRGRPRPRARLELKPETGRDTARPPRRALPGPACQDAYCHPIKRRPHALGSAELAAAASRPWSPSHHRHCCRLSVTPQPSPHCSAAAGAPHCSEDSHQPFSPLLPLFPRVRLLAGALRPRLAVVSLPWSSALHLNPVDVFLSSLSCSQA